MVTKTLTITKEAYEQLKALKRPDESFSEVVKRITASKQDIMQFAGILSDIDAKEIKREIKKMREYSSRRLRQELKSWR